MGSAYLSYEVPRERRNGKIRKQLAGRRHMQSVDVDGGAGSRWGVDSALAG